MKRLSPLLITLGLILSTLTLSASTEAASANTMARESSARSEPNRWPPAQRYSAKRKLKFENQVHRLINRERTRRGLPAVRQNNCAKSYAQDWSKVMDRRDLFEHSNLRSFFKRCPGFGYVGENIALGYLSPESVVDAWMRSPGHRRNILNRKFNVHSTGVVYDRSRQSLVWTQVLATRK